MPQPVAETTTSQLYDAYAYRRKLQGLYHAAVHYNASRPAAEKMRLPNDKATFGQFAGDVINATLIDELVNAKYPAYPISDSSVYYAQQQGLITSYIQHMKNSGHPDVADWVTQVPKYGKDFYSGKISGDQAKTDTQIIRNYAIKYAETVPGFLAFYDKVFRYQFGPLEGVK